MQGVRHAGIVVSDIEKSLGFYRDLLGLKVTKRKDESGPYIDRICAMKNASVTTVKLAAKDGNLVELLHFRSHPGSICKAGKLDSIGISHIAFTVADIENEYARLAKAGVAFNSRPEMSTDGYAKVVFCKDPDGVFVELVEVLKNKDEA